MPSGPWSGAENFFTGMSDDEHTRVKGVLRALQEGPARAPSLHEGRKGRCRSGAGGRISPRQRPLLALTLRQLVHRKAARIAEKVRLPAWNDAGIREIAQQEKENLFIAAPYAHKAR